MGSITIVNPMHIYIIHFLLFPQKVLKHKALINLISIFYKTYVINRFGFFTLRSFLTVADVVLHTAHKNLIYVIETFQIQKWFFFSAFHNFVQHTTYYYSFLNSFSSRKRERVYFNGMEQ